MASRLLSAITRGFFLITSQGRALVSFYFNPLERTAA